MRLKQLMEIMPFNEKDLEVIEKLEQKLKELEKDEKSIAAEIAKNRNRSNGSDYQEALLKDRLEDVKKDKKEVKQKLMFYKTMSK